jgi:6-pyruvoyltetrahydropterin/6-carboxytetrahydropterin synthase
MDHNGKCSHPHGHNAVVEVELASDSLDQQGMVMDFAEVKRRLARFIEDGIDHRMLLRHDDPLVSAFREVHEEPFVMKDNPTAENIARLIFERAKAEHLPVAAVRLWETEDAFAEYREKHAGGV